MNPRRPNVLLVDDHALVRHSIAQMLESELEVNVCCEASSVEEALEILKSSEPDLIITDLALPGKSGLELIKSARTYFPSLPILVLSMHDEKLYAERVLKLGAKGYIMKQEAASRLLDAVKEVLSGKIYVSEQMRDNILNWVAGAGLQQHEHPTMGLSLHELEVLRMIGQGLSNIEIATQSNRSIKTIEFHRANIRRKLNLRDSHELHHFAIRWLETESPQ